MNQLNCKRWKIKCLSAIHIRFLKIRCLGRKRSGGGMRGRFINRIRAKKLLPKLPKRFPQLRWLSTLLLMRQLLVLQKTGQLLPRPHLLLFVWTLLFLRMKMLVPTALFRNGRGRLQPVHSLQNNTICALCFLIVMQESLHSWSLFTNQNCDSETKLKLHSQQLRAIRSSRPPTGSFAPKQCFLPVSIKFTSCPRINGSMRRRKHVSMFLPRSLFSNTWFYRRQFYVSSFPFFSKFW